MVVLVLMAYAAYSIVRSQAKTGEKILWFVLVLIVPVIGLILWALLGPGSPLKR
jgi:hypothetical protein